MAHLTYHRVVQEERGVAIEQEIPATTAGLIRVGILATVGFAAMALMVDERSRILCLVLGALVITLISLFIAYVLWQSRYGTSRLIARQPFELGNSFAGTIVTNLSHESLSGIRIKIRGGSHRSEITIARVTVDLARLQRAADGSLLIPFTVPAPVESISWRPLQIRLRARTATWPIGWGATFLIADASRF